MRLNHITIIFTDSLSPTLDELLSSRTDADPPDGGIREASEHLHQ